MKIGTACGLGLLVLFSLNGCQSNDEDFYIDRYFDLKSVIDSQLAHYNKNPPDTINKTINFEGREESKNQPSDKLIEIKKILETAIINKPGFRNMYNTGHKHAVNGEDTVYSVIKNTLKKGEEAMVQSIHAYYAGPPDMPNLRNIVIHKDKRNYLYHNTQLIHMRFRDGLLRELVMEGLQQILYFDPEHFKITISLQG